MTARIWQLVATAVVVLGCGGAPQSSVATEPSLASAGPALVTRPVRGGDLTPVPRELCGVGLLPGGLGHPDMEIANRDAARERAIEFVGTMRASTGVFVPDTSSGGWTFGVLDLDVVGERDEGEGWQFAFPFQCPSRRDIARVVYVSPAGSIELMYPPVAMPSWQPLVVEGEQRPETGVIQHPELIGLWSGGQDEQGSPCSVGPFAYDGREILGPVYAMRDWEFRTEDSLWRSPVRWRGRALQVQLGSRWQDFAELTEDGRFIARLPGDSCSLVPAMGDACYLSQWSRPHPAIPRDLPRLAGPGGESCDAAGQCVVHSSALVAYLCGSHTID